MDARGAGEALTGKRVPSRIDVILNQETPVFKKRFPTTPSIFVDKEKEPLPKGTRVTISTGTEKKQLDFHATPELMHTVFIEGKDGGRFIRASDVPTLAD